MNPSYWSTIWHQLVWNLATNATTILLGVVGMTVLGLGPIGRALASRIRGQPMHATPQGDPSLLELKAAVTEALERLDFNERVLAEISQRPSIGSVPPTSRQAPNETTLG